MNQIHYAAFAIPAFFLFLFIEYVLTIKKMEHILLSPSLHGVHHASDEKYLDKNYGDIFTFWDKLFGTFQKEEEAPKYGLTHPVKSYSFLWQHFHYYLEIIDTVILLTLLKPFMRRPASMISFLYSSLS